MISIRIPVAVFEIFSRSAVYNKVTVGVLVKAADYIQHSGLAAARRAEYRNELALSEPQIYSAQRVHHAVARRVFLFDLL